MKKKINLRMILIVVSLAVLVIVGGLLMKDRIIGWQADRTQRDVKELYYGKKTGLLDWLMPRAFAEEEETKTAEEPEEEPPEIRSDFLELYEANSDIVGWLVAGEKIDYPVVQRDNEFYLKHGYFGGGDSNGTIFLNQDCKIWPRDDVLLIHGHNMNSGVMFGKLTKFEEFEYLAQYPLVTFRTIYDEADVYYTPVAVFNASMLDTNSQYFNISRINFLDDEEATEIYGEPAETPEIAPETTEDTEEQNIAEEPEERHSAEFRAYLDELAEWSLWEPLVDVNENDKLIALITCSYHQVDGRCILVCRQLREDETPEAITELYAPYVPVTEEAE